MAELKRDCVKYIRDKAKAAYKKAPACEICGATDNLDLHHYNTLTQLLKLWLKETGLKEDDVVQWREDFIERYHTELYTDVVTLCRTHHQKLHSIYGKNPTLVTAKKQARWVGIQREKYGLVS